MKNMASNFELQIQELTYSAGQKPQYFFTKLDAPKLWGVVDNIGTTTSNLPEDTKKHTDNLLAGSRSLIQ